MSKLTDLLVVFLQDVPGLQSANCTLNCILWNTVPNVLGLYIHIQCHVLIMCIPNLWLHYQNWPFRGWFLTAVLPTINGSKVGIRKLWYISWWAVPNIMRLYICTQEVLIIVYIPNLWLFFQNCIFHRRFFMALLVLHGEKLSVRGAPLLLLLHDTCWGGCALMLLMVLSVW